MVSGACSAYTEHRCTNNYCIGKELRCDGHHSCSDGSDETTRGAGCDAGSGAPTRDNPSSLPQRDASPRDTRDTHPAGTHPYPSPGRTIPTTTSTPPSKDIYSMSCTLSLFSTLLYLWYYFIFSFFHNCLVCLCIIMYPLINY